MAGLSQRLPNANVVPRPERPPGVCGPPEAWEYLCGLSDKELSALWEKKRQHPTLMKQGLAAAMKWSGIKIGATTAGNLFESLWAELSKMRQAASKPRQNASKRVNAEGKK
jgi:hypothetical protein